MLFLPRRGANCRLCSLALGKIVIVLLHFVCFIKVVDGEDEQQQLQINHDGAGQICFEPRDLGVLCPKDGPGKSKMFYYNKILGSCQPFIYKGCAGNLNRFGTSAECRKTCSKLSKKTQEWVLAERCNASHLIPDGHYIECVAGKCPEGHKCHPAEGVCCPRKKYVCALQDDSGTFADGVPDKPRFAWSADIKSCWRFSYFGAKGNYNNFATFHDCLNFCDETIN
ncbi:hypothetical protein niasHT_014246 [Heterodera trifolii]|uniref:BPTI/Kunitz inhibitor domain-containing protein n=1 Tax=Heterodera trifolii TaxID=157864 RepID=A0ABD2KZ36_9BILA